MVAVNGFTTWATTWPNVPLNPWRAVFVFENAKIHVFSIIYQFCDGTDSVLHSQTNPSSFSLNSDHSAEFQHAQKYKDVVKL